MRFFLPVSLLLTGVVGASASTNRTSAAAVVDLGYSLHRGTLVVNNTAAAPDYYNFSNIQYASVPRRFALPAVPPTDRTVKGGQRGVVCPQAWPAWGDTAAEFLYNQTVSWPNVTLADIQPVDPRTAEDCLFLDVLVSRSVYERRAAGARAPVLVWIHGGGFVVGSKGEYGDGEGFIARGNGNVVYVAINYRLGLFGWLAGASFEKEAAANLGLLDQRFALDWVRKNIHLFGGDASRVTIMGESAGGGAVMHQITAYGGSKGPVPFRQAIAQSPFYQPVGRDLQERAYRKVLGLVNATSFSALQTTPSSALQTANALLVGNARPYGTYVFGPTVDGSFVPDPVSLLLSSGRHDRSLNIMTGHTSDEGLYFTSPYITDDAAYERFLHDLFPHMSRSASRHVADVLYPPAFDGSYGYTDQTGRVDATIGDASLVCNTYFLNDALCRRNFAYKFSVPRGLHGYDLAYTFYDDAGDGSAATTNVTLAVLMQHYFINFARTGDPNGRALPPWPRYNASVPTEQNLNVTGLGPMHDEAVSERCRWWRDGLYM